MSKDQLDNFNQSSPDSFATGLASKSKASFKGKRFSTRLYMPRLGAIVTLIVFILIIRFIYSSFEEDAALSAKSATIERVWENPNFPYEFLEVTDVTIKENTNHSLIEYEVINHSDYTITFGYGPDLKPDDHVHMLHQDAIKVYMSDGSVTKLFGGQTIESKEKKTLYVKISEQLEDIKKIEAVFKNDTTEETVNWGLEAVN